jgi:transketolase
MRSNFVDQLVAIAERDDRVLLLTADLGYGVIERFRDQFPARFLNVGVAEQNMVAVAAGLATDGFLPFCYSIGTFSILRPYEFIRNLAVHDELSVRFVGVGGGVDYGVNGPTHFLLEDFAVMRTQPGMAIVAPLNNEQAKSALCATYDRPGPVYYRLAKDSHPAESTQLGQFEIESLTWYRNPPQPHTLVLFTGAMAADAVGAVEQLGDGGIAVAGVAGLAPLPMIELRRSLAGVRLVVTIEAHYRTGGLGSAIAEVIADEGFGTRLVRVGFDNFLPGAVGSRQYLHRRAGLDAESLADTIRQATKVSLD